MASDLDIRVAEKAQATAALGAGGVVLQETPDVLAGEQETKDKRYHGQTKDVSDVTPSTNHCSTRGSFSEDEGEEEEEQEEQEEEQQHEPPEDLEAVTNVASNNRPPFTIFTVKQRRFIVFMAACGGFFSAASANIYFPALNTLSVEFHESSTLINLTLTTYMIMQGLAPTFIGDMADMLGRRPAYIFCFVIYIGANIGLALCQNYASLLVLRMMQSAGSSATIALGSGVVADIATSSERGNWMGWVTAGPMVA